MVEAVGSVMPKAFVAENVGGLFMKRNRDSLERVLGGFGDLGYDMSCRMYDASGYGVPQTRKRVFIVGTRDGIPRFVAPAPALSRPVSAREAIGDLEGLGRDEAFSHVWSLAAPSAEQGNRRLDSARPGFTVRAECHGNIHFHYRLGRRISMREAARLQSFPDSFVFPCKLRETERQIGNAVPPVLAWHIANAVMDCVRGRGAASRGAT
jgi:DNA (cytosine-5)-methyltransferase 1